MEAGIRTRMTFAEHCSELHQIAVALVAENSLIQEMREEGEAPEVELEARSMAAGIAQIGLLIQPLQLAALDLETENAWVA